MTNIQMIANKRGQGLPLSTVIIAILVVLVLIVLVGFFLGGTTGLTNTIKTIFFGTTAGTDKVLAIQTCDQRCNQAQVLSEADRPKSAFCTRSFNIDDNSDGQAEFYDVGDGTTKYVRFYCNVPKDTGVVKSLKVTCPEVTCIQPAD
jgi:hypothetical protein